MSDTEIYVRLLDEVVDVWRPVQALAMGGNLYEINEQPYDREIERWQFVPGEVVVCQPVEFEEGVKLAAVKSGSALQDTGA